MSVIGQQAQVPVDLFIAGHDHAAVASAAEGLEGRQAEGSRIGESADGTAIIVSAGGERGIFDDL